MTTWHKTDWQKDKKRNDKMTGETDWQKDRKRNNIIIGNGMTTGQEETEPK